MRTLIKILCILLIVNVLISCKSKGSQEYAGYLFAYFEGKDGDRKNQEQLRFALSSDAVNWKALNGNKPILVSEEISKSGGIRDPHILRGEDGKTFYMVATDMSTARNGWKDNPGMVLLRSDDLITWKHAVVELEKLYPETFKNVQYVWAPQTIYDPAAKKYLVYFTIKYRDDAKLDFYGAYANEDFSGLEGEPFLMFSPKHGGIDADIVCKDGTYHLFFKGNTKDENGKEFESGIKQATSSSLTGAWEERFDYLDAYHNSKTNVEGSSVFKLNESDTYILMYDLYSSGRYEFQRSTDLYSFYEKPESFTKDFHPRHGSVISITQEEMKRLNEKWGEKKSEVLNIKNDVFWNTKDGTPIYSQGGGIFKFKDPKSGIEKYYWYGVHYKEAEVYRNDPSVTYKGCTFVAVTCYSSTDLVNWSFEANVLTREEVEKHHKKTTWVGRLGVAYIAEIKKYALIVQHGSEVLFTLSDSPTGNFTWHRRKNMEKIIGTSNTGDQTVFTDEDTGKSYLIYCYGRGRDKIYVSEIGVKDGVVDLLDCTQIFEGSGREGNCMFKYKGKYYMYASNLYGWDASFAYYLAADDIRGPYLPENEMLVTPGSAEDYAHVTQTGFFVTVKGSKQETVIYCGDRWADFAGNGLGYNQWCPLSFDGDKPYFNSLSSWNFNHATGEWQVADDNNFVKNGSFEADRNRIPSSFKPIQEQLLGWHTEVIRGNKISTDSSSGSPVLNYFNTELDRKIVVGEKSLNISDRVDFKRKISQHIASSPYVTLADGSYTLAAKVKNSGGFSALEMYAESGRKRHVVSFTTENAAWTTIEIKKVAVKNGKVEVGFVAEGEAAATCQVDDVSLVKSN